ncbi:MFS general substrate transporter [Dothidotthia symphoricarpi CBS 119687]|uniref:MFS general substrate transporter n=1 Tax=Dothidotthia symphoricarpi CBS 119687 TaxID=1392245 RepID=A0A6A6ANX3_9PLEO|nr:MFS general substrate transporter [Dothidotthia symphoricarpi CBS 119687]KAF2133619.1 MFS general substrate transporter [Dothidotthia symphoricarpi CBS 119687]
MSSKISIESHRNQNAANREQDKELHVTNKEQVATSREEEGTTLESAKSTTPAATVASPAPDGGLRAWLQVMGSFFLMFNSWGILNTFGSYQAYYETDMLASTSPSAISWVGSIQAFLLLVVGALTGPLFDRGYLRALIFGGTVLLLIGQMMLSLCHEYWQVLLAQAFCIGIGAGALFTPAVAILSQYFSTRVGMAIGIAASGSSVGGVIYPIVFKELLPRIGFAWTTRVLGFLILGTMIVPNAVMRTRVLPAKSRSLLDLPAFTIPAYAFQAMGFFLGFIGLYMPFFYAQVYALQERITNENLAFYLIAIMNSTSAFGRILPNILADKLGPFNVVIPCCLISGVLCICFISVTSTAGIVVLMAFYGFFSGSFVSIPPTLVVSLSLNAREKIGARLGQGFACTAVGVLIGTPIGGAIQEHSGFAALWTFGGVMLFGSAVFLAAGRVAHKGWGVGIKA